MNEWLNSHSTPINTYIDDDTLFVKFIYKPVDPASIGWMKWTTLVRISAPELLSIEGMDTKFEMIKLKQKELTVKMSGRSTFEVESLEFKSPQTMDIQSVKADVRGYSLLDLGHVQINSLNLKIEDSAAVILSGGALRKLK